MNSLPSNSAYLAQAGLGQADIYTDLNSLQKLKNQEDKSAAIRQVAEQFEAMFINIMMKSMRDANAVFEEGSPFNSNEAKFYRDMHDQQLSLSLAHGQNSVGIADALYRQMSRQYEKYIAQPPGKATIQAPASPALSRRETLTRTPAEFVAQVQPSIDKAARALGVPASVLIAQSALETGWGASVLADEKGQSSHNIFNIKAGADWSGRTVEINALEYEQGSLVQQKSAFRAYDSLAEAVEDYVRFVQNNPRYQRALTTAGNGQAYIEALADAGYATDPEYALKVGRTHQRVTAELAALNTPVNGG